MDKTKTKRILVLPPQDDPMSVVIKLIASLPEDVLKIPITADDGSIKLLTIPAADRAGWEAKFPDFKEHDVVIMTEQQAKDRGLFDCFTGDSI